MIAIQISGKSNSRPKLQNKYYTKVYRIQIGFGYDRQNALTAYRVKCTYGIEIGSHLAYAQYIIEFKKCIL